MNSVAQREIEHGKMLAGMQTEDIWGLGHAGRPFACSQAGRSDHSRRALTSGTKALEIGCGTGMFTELFAQTGARLVAVDISGELIAKANSRKLPDRVTFLDKRFEDCEIDGPFDAVIGSSVLHHLDVEASLAKIRTLLKPGGVMSFAEPNMLNPQVFAERRFRRWFPYVSPDETAFVRRRLGGTLSRARTGGCATLRQLMSESSRTDGRAGLFWTLLPHLVFAGLFVVTFKRWILPFEDSGREMNTALRLAQGDALYRDVGYSYGPLPPVVDGLLLRAFGRSLDVLVAWRTVLALLGVEALRRLARRLAPNESLAAAASAFAIAACAFGIGGSWPFPYSVAALAGTVGTWWALELALASRSWTGSIAAGVVAGLAACSKLEFVPVTLASLVFVLWLRRSRLEAVLAGVLAAGEAGIAYVVPIVRFGEHLMKRQGFLIALSVPESWRRVYESVLFGGLTPAAFVRGGFREVLFPSAVAVALALLLRDGGRTFNVALMPLLFVVGGLTSLSPGNGWLHALLPLAACVAVGGLVRAAAAWRRRESSPDPVVVGVALVMLSALVRQPFFLRNPVYGAFSAPLALVVALCWIGRRSRARNAIAALVLGLSAAQIGLRVQGIGMAAMTRTELPGASLFLVPAESRFVTEAARVIREVVPEGGTIGIFPEPGFLLFVTGRKNPFVDELFLPGVQDAAAEDLMIRRLRERPPDALLVTNRAYPEFGGAVYGHGLLDRFFAEVSGRYVPARRIGGEAGPVPLRHASEGLLFVPRAGRGP